MNKTTAAGSGILIVALGLLLYNIADTVADLRDWHGATHPEFFAAIMKQIGSVILGAVGGALLPQPDKNKEGQW